MQMFVTNMQQHVCNEVAEKLWAKFKSNLDNVSSLEDLLTLH